MFVRHEQVQLPGQFCRVPLQGLLIQSRCIQYKTEQQTKGHAGHFGIATPGHRRRQPCSVLLLILNPQPAESFELFFAVIGRGEGDTAARGNGRYKSHHLTCLYDGR
jgi:hypothetical protein